jgi:hypothetical protein
MRNNAFETRNSLLFVSLIKHLRVKLNVSEWLILALLQDITLALA